MNMIEKVARALIGVHGATIDASVEDMTQLARAAIEAMREASEGMVSAGEKEMAARHTNLDCFRDPYVNSTWSAMIDAALKEETE